MNNAKTYRSVDLDALYERARAAEATTWRDMEAAFDAALAQGDGAPTPPLREGVVLVLRLLEAGEVEAAPKLADAIDAWMAAGDGRTPDGEIGAMWEAAHDLARVGAALHEKMRAAMVAAALDGNVGAAYPAVREICSDPGNVGRRQLIELLERHAPSLARTFGEAIAMTKSLPPPTPPVPSQPAVRSGKPIGAEELVVALVGVIFVFAVLVVGLASFLLDACHLTR